MTLPYYASAEQIMRDKTELARKGIARGRSVVALVYDEGVLFVAENPSATLHKVSELYDRIGFAAVGKYNEFENLRVAGVRYADLRGYSYDRVDVTARGLANAYAQTLGTVFTTEAKPLEVELVVVEVGAQPSGDQIYRLSYDGSVADEHGWVVMGGQAERLASLLGDRWQAGMSLRDALALGVHVLGAPTDDASKQRSLEATALEVAVLDRTRPRRAFRRLTGAALEVLLARPDEAAAPATGPDGDDPAPVS